MQVMQLASTGAWARLVTPLAAAMLCAAQSASAAPPRDGLPAPLREALAAAQLTPEQIGFVVMPLAGRGPTLAHRGGEVMQPGSTMKLVTSVVALERLGPNFRGFTQLMSAAPLVGDVLQGDLVLKGGADPELGVPQLLGLLAELRWAGTREISGNLLLDRSLFRPARIDEGLPPFDQAPEFAYNVIPDALFLTGNVLPLELAADAETVRATLSPPLPGVELINRLQVHERACSTWDELPYWQSPTTTTRSAPGETGLTIELNGQFPRNCTRRPHLQLMDRTLLAELLMRRLWSDLGGSWSGRAVEGSAPEGARVLARRVSRPWGEVLRHLNKTSDNAETRLLFLQLGALTMASNPQATTRELAGREVRRWFSEAGIDTTGMVLDNGSGLSRSERITPLQMARMLKVALNGKTAPDLLMSLPTAGVDGTMRLRLRDSPAQGWARVKTGTLSNVAALAGLVPDPSGRPWVMVAMINAEQAPRRGRPVLDALVNWIATSGPMAPRGPSNAGGP